MLRATSRLYSTGLKDTFRLTQLPNGLRVASSGLPGHFSAVGAYLNAGSRFETDTTKGCTHILDRLAFKSTRDLSGEEMAKQLESLGGNYQCTSSREAMIYQASVFNRDVGSMLNLISQTVRHPQLLYEEIEEQKTIAQYEVNEIFQKPELALPETLHTTAYNNKSLGSPLLCPLDLIPNITREKLVEYRNALYNPQNTVAAFVGVSHEEAVELASKYFEDWEAKGTTETIVTQAHYTGGESCIAPAPYYHTTPVELYHFQVAFESFPIEHENIYAVAVLQMLLGGGSSFSAGGPGKGMFSRLYTDILNVYYQMDSCNSFNHSYKDSGLFGINVSCFKQNTEDAVNIIAQEIASYLEKDSINETELNRAKNQLKSSLLMGLESKLVELEDMGRQVITQGKKTLITDLISKIEKVTVSDITNVARTIFTGEVKNVGNGTGLPTIVMQGEKEAFGDPMSVLRKYGLGKHDITKNNKKRHGWF